ncbi:hypothetical protein PLIIFM63780_001996 [Purpureocillium lilacinum]|nr:hypothetical protein PLIIFM63780_001996 [Purpureocillium lilacinum]
MGNRKHWSEMLDILLPKSRLDPKVLLQQTITRASIASVKFLIDQFSLDLTAEPTLVAKAAENLEFGPQIIDLLLQRFHDINITDDIILAIINHGESGASGVSYVCDSLKVLFDRLGPDFQVTNRVLLGAARAEVEDDCDGQVFKVVFQRASVELEITQEVVMAAAQNSNAWDIMQLLLSSRPAEICMTEEILCATIPKLEGSYSYLLRNAAKHSIKITEKTIAAAARDSDTGREAFLQVLNAADANTRITQDVLLAAATNYDVNGTQIMWLLLRESMNVDEVGTEVLEKVLQGDKSGIMSVILKRRGATIRLTKDLVQGWIANERTSGKALKFLLQYKAAELHSILDAMSTDEQAEFMDRWDQLFKQFEQDSWESIFKKHGK